MAKPIFLIKCSDKIPFEKTKEIQKMLEKKLEDWHVLIFGVKELEGLEVAAYNADNLPEVDIETLKKELCL